MDVGIWLRSLGLGQYEATFRDNEIGGAVLPKLTVDDLKDLGVAVVGHRRKIMSAIEELNAESVARDAMETLPTQAAPPVSASPDGAERRPITILFCDLVGSTNLATRLDAEDWRNLVNAYLDEASAAVTNLGGHVLKKLGDGLMALFGYPRAQENDAERAVRAALAIQRALADLNVRNARSGAPELSARIGIESGSVVVDAAGEVFGEAPNVAARVQAAAEPGTVLVTASVQRQTAGLFVAEDKGAHDLKGVLAPVALYRIVRASGGGRRGGARALTPLVGREDELALLTRRWSRALVGEGQFVQIVGEPGIGKSRLVEEFRAKLGETPHTWVEWAASQLLQNTPLHPLAEWGRLRFGGADATHERRFTDLENTLSLIGLDAAEYAPLLAPLVDIPLPPDRREKFPPEELRRRQLAAMTAWVLAGARSQPAVVAFEDLHWADPTSLDLLRALAERGAQSPLLVVATTRPEFRAPWAMRSHHGVVALAPLDRAQVRRMVGEIASRHALSDEMIDGVGERTGGVPLFVEEVTRLLLERNAQGGAQAIPPTLQQSLAARLDRLGEAREVAQIGAVLGRVFSYRLLRDVAAAVADRGPPGQAGLTEAGYGGLDELRLQAALDRLTEADLLFADGGPPTAAYRFKHALIQDAAYNSLLKSRRQALHRRAAEALRVANAEPEAIAHHFTEAGLDDLAIEWWGKAGDQALRRSAFQEAIVHLGKAIEMADKAGARAQQATGGLAAPNQRLTQLSVAYGNALIAARGFGAPETTEAFARARQSAVGEQDAPERLAADFGLWAASYSRGDLPSMRAHSADFLGDIATSPDSPEAGVAHRVQGMTHWYAGEFLDARNCVERALARFQPGRDDDLAYRFGVDPGVSGMAYLALALWPLGEVDRAVSLVERMNARIAGLTHANTLALGTMHAAMFALMSRDRSRARTRVSELVRILREHDLRLFRALGAFLEGWAATDAGALADGLEGMRRGLESLREQNALLFDGLIKILLSEAEALAGDPERALATVDEALATAERAGSRAFEAELHRVRGEILLKRDPAIPAPAEEGFLTAIAVAKRQATRSFELRAALSLAELYQSTGRVVDAHAVLAPALEGFSPTSEMAEIAEAQTLVSALSKNDEVKAAAAQRQRRLQLQTGYAQAVAFSKGFLAEETKAAFERASEIASHDGGGRERFGAYYGRWIVSFTHEQLDVSLAIAREFLRAAESEGCEMEAAAACRALGLSHFVAGDFRSAQMRLEHAMRLHRHTHDEESRRLFGFDPQAGTMAYLACVNLVCGELSRGRELIDAAVSRANGLDHLPTRANTLLFKAIYEAMRGDPEATLAAANALVATCRPAGLSLYLTCGEACAGWARARGGDLEGGTAAMRRSRASLIEQGGLALSPFFAGLLAGLEAEARRLDAASALVEETLTKAAQTGSHFSDSMLMRLRGDILLKRNPANHAPSEEAFRGAIAVAKQQGARSYELLASFSLAKLYQSTGRPADAHAVLAPALEGFSPTPEMPEIGEAQALLAALAETDEVKTDAEHRQRRQSLQVGLANALLQGRGMNARETQVAFERAGELIAGVEDPVERLAILYGPWAGELVRGDARRMLEIAAVMMERAADGPAALGARRCLGMSQMYAGDLAGAETTLRWVVDHYDFDRHHGLAVRFSYDPGVVATYYLAFSRWLLGDANAAHALVAEARRLAERINHPPTIVATFGIIAFIDCVRRDPTRALANAERAVALAGDFNLPTWRMIGTLNLAQARADLTATPADLNELREKLAGCDAQGVGLPEIHRSYLAEGYGRVGELEPALALANQALANIEAKGLRAFLPEAHRVRGEILLKRGPADPAPAEQAFHSAIAVAREQGSRSFELRAALSLAKLLQSMGRPVEAHDVLARALEGFSPNPEMPQIAEAQGLLTALA